MIDRILILVAFSVLASGLYYAIQQWSLHRATQRVEARDPLLETFKPGRPAILYFTAEWCGACISRQRPALDALKSEVGDDIQIIQVDVEQQQDGAKRWGVMSLPTTFILNADGEPVAVNYGVATMNKLKQQLEG